MYHVTKHYPHSLGLSACFRQPGATSHCKDWHGYPLAFTFEFMARELDANDWVIDFGSLKPLKEWLVATFDHKMIIRADDPALPDALAMQKRGWATVITMRRVGMEAFAATAFAQCKQSFLIRRGYTPRVSLTKVTVAEHEGNSASYSEPL